MGQHFLAHEVESDDSRRRAVIEVASYGVTDIGSQVVERICLGKDGIPQSAGAIAAFRGFADQKDDLVNSRFAPSSRVSLES
jgi:hypothetical protein